MLTAQTMSVSIDRGFDDVYAFACRPDNFPLGRRPRPGPGVATGRDLGNGNTAGHGRGAIQSAQCVRRSRPHRQHATGAGLCAAAHRTER